MKLHYFSVIYPLIAASLVLSTSHLGAVEVNYKGKSNKLSKDVQQNITTFKREQGNLAMGSPKADVPPTDGLKFHRDSGVVLQFKGLNLSDGLPGTIESPTVSFNINQGRGQHPLQGAWMVFLMEPDGKTHQLASGQFNGALFAQGTITFPAIKDPLFGIYTLGVYINNTLNNTLLSLVFCPEPPPSTSTGHEIVLTTTKDNYWIQNGDGGPITLSGPHSRGFCILPLKSMTLTNSYAYGNFTLSP